MKQVVAVDPASQDRLQLHRDAGPAQRKLKRGVFLSVALALAAGSGFAAAHVFAAPAISGSPQDSYPTSLASVIERELSSQTQVTGSLEYAGQYTAFNQTQGTLTELPAIGQVVSQGQVFYAMDGIPVVLLYGGTPAYRTLQLGTSGPDVTQLNNALVTLGDAAGTSLAANSDVFSAATTVALKRLQANVGLASTGVLNLGEAVFLPTAARITAEPARIGQPIMPGQAVLQATSTVHQVVIQLDASQQSSVKVGDQVGLTLPTGAVATGAVSAVGTVATQPAQSGGGTAGPSSDNSGSSSQPTVEVDVSLNNPSAAGALDRAPVVVTITTATVAHALVVPVAALLPVSGAGYEVEIVTGARHRLLPVTTGLFDDADGLVQITGRGLVAGQQVVIPQI